MHKTSHMKPLIATLFVLCGSLFASMVYASEEGAIVYLAEATTTQPATQPVIDTSVDHQSNNDPLESINRVIFSVNDSIDKAVVKPVAKGYDAIVPDIAKTGVGNFFGNLSDLYTGVNNMLQGKVGQGIGDMTRVFLNSTVGIYGLLDVASEAGIEKHKEDFLISYCQFLVHQHCVIRRLCLLTRKQILCARRVMFLVEIGCWVCEL
jgi:MlaA lipoprotein